MPPRDFQKDSVYLAEIVWNRDLPHDDWELENAQQFCNAVTQSRGWKMISPTSRPVVVRLGTRWSLKSSAHNDWLIELSPRNGLRRQVVLHEMTHVLIMRRWGWSRFADHGPEYVFLMGLLVEQTMTPQEYEQWIDAMRSFDVLMGSDTLTGVVPSALL